MEPIKTYRKIPTQKELAQAMNISPDYVSKLIRGERKTPKRLKQLNALLSKNIKAA